MDAKARKVFNALTKLGGEQEVFDLSIEVKMTEDAIQTHLGKLSEEGVVSCRRDDSGKEFWSVAAAQPAPPPPSDPAGANDPAGGASARKKGKATAAGPDDRFDEFIVDSKASAPAPIPPEPVEFDSFEPASPAAAPAKESPQAVEDDFEPKPPKREKRAKAADADFEPKPVKEKPAKPSKKAPDSGDNASESKQAKESKTEREFSAGPDDHFDEFAERVPVKPNLPIPLMAVAAALVLVVILFIVGGSGGKSKKIKTEVNEVRTELTVIKGKLDSLSAAIAKLQAKDKALSDEINNLKKAASQIQSQSQGQSQGQDAPAKKTTDKKKTKGRQ